MDGDMLEALILRAADLLDQGVATLSAVGVEHLGLLVGILIWIQMVRLTAVLAKGTGVNAGDRRVQNVESEVKRLARELHTLHTYVTTTIDSPTSKAR